MIIVDTSVWIDHIRRPIELLGELLLAGEVRQHPFVTGEIKLGSIASRDRVCAGLAALPPCRPVEIGELLAFIDTSALAGCGVGLVDASLLASASIENDRLWTRDKRLAAQAERLGFGYTEN